MPIGRGILKTIKESEAKNIFFHHGDSEALSRYINEKTSINVLNFNSKNELKSVFKLFLNLDSSNSINKKLEILINYFSTNNDLENSWSIYLLTGKKNKRFVSGKSLKNIYSDIYQFPLWLIDTCYLKVGDSAEVITLLIKNKSNHKK